MSKLSAESSVRSQLEMLRKDKASKESQVQKLLVYVCLLLSSEAVSVICCFQVQGC